MPVIYPDHDAQARLLEKVDALATGQADIAARLKVIEESMRDAKADAQRTSDKLESADERRMEALLRMDEKRAAAILDIEHTHVEARRMVDSRLTKLEAAAASMNGIRKHAIGIVVAVVTAVLSTWAAIKAGLGGHG